MSNIGITAPEKALTVQLEKLLSMRDLNLRTIGGPALRWKRNAARLANNLGGNLSFAEQQLAMRAGMLAVLLEDHECRALLGQKISLGDYTAMITVQKQIFVALHSSNLKRVPKNITMDPLEYAQQREHESSDE